MTEARKRVEAKNAQLARLRADAELIGDFARIIDSKEELARLKQDYESLEKDMRGTDYFIRLASAYPPPRNEIGRKQQLSAQITELAEMSSKAERGELGRRSSGDDVQRKLQILEQTRGLDLHDLGDELDRLRAERIRLEDGR